MRNTSPMPSPGEPLDGITRRGSLMTLGGAGLAAIVGGSATADAKKHKKKNKQKTRRIHSALCAPQVEQCRTTVTLLKETRRNSCVVMPSPPVKPPSSSSV